jgi:hypothetical protein
MLSSVLAMSSVDEPSGHLEQVDRMVLPAP